MFQAWCGGRWWLVGLVLLGMRCGVALTQVAAPPKELTPEQSELVDKAIANEAKLLEELKHDSPLVEIYSQELKTVGGISGGFVPEKDQYRLYRVDFDRVAKGTETKAPKEALPFFRMLVVDTKSFDRESYKFEFMHNDRLGGMSCAVFNILPMKNGHGQSTGRIFVERQGGNIVRYTGRQGEYAIDSRRRNVEPGVWMPTWVYIEKMQSEGLPRDLKFASVLRVWGYQTKKPITAKATGASDDEVLARLFDAGLIDAASAVDAKLSVIANEILRKNSVTAGGPIQVRVLLGEQLATMSFGRTVLISRGLLDTTLMTGDSNAQRGVWRAALAFPVAQIVLGETTDIGSALSDGLLYPDGVAFGNISMRPLDVENEKAAKKAMELLSPGDFKIGQDEYSLFLQELELKASGLKALRAPVLGDGLLQSDGKAWMHALAAQGPKFSEAEQTQIHANALGTGLKIDPWSDTVREAFLGGKAPQAAGFAFAIVPMFDMPTYFQAAATVAPK